MVWNENAYHKSKFFATQLRKYMCYFPYLTSKLYNNNYCLVSNKKRMIISIKRIILYKSKNKIEIKIKYNI